MSGDVSAELSRIGDALTQFSEDFHTLIDSLTPAFEAINEDVEDIALQDLVEVPQ